MDDDYIRKHYERWAVEFLDDDNDMAVVSVLIRKEEGPSEEKAIEEAKRVLKESPYTGVRERANAKAVQAYRTNNL